MNHIDAIEGTVHAILERLHQNYIDGSRDDSDYILNARAVIEGTQRFVEAHPELMTPPDLLCDVLYEAARKLWLGSRTDAAPAEPETDAAAYDDYYYDYIYRHGAYPL